MRRLGVRRADRRLDLLARITDRATGRVQVRFRAAGTTTRLDVPIKDGRVRAKLPLPARQARLGTGIATIVYPGSPTVRAQKVRLRAASRPARLTARRPTLVAGRLATRGTIARTAAGVVRVELSYANAAGTLRTRRYKARIEDGRWSHRQGLDRRTRDELATRRGVVVADVAYTGRLATRTRGELLSYQVLPAR